MRYVLIQLGREILGRMDTMPRLVKRTEHPPEVDAAIEVFGNRGHTAVLRVLAENGPSLRGQLLEATDLNQATLGHHLETLEKHGAITVNIPQGQRRGRSVTYSLDKTRLEALWSAHLHYITD